MTAGRVWVNGLPATQVDAADRGLAYGDGLFETLRIAQGRAVLGPRHFARLAASAEALGITLDSEALAADFRRFLDGSGDAVAKIIVTRGAGGRGYLPAPDLRPTVVFSLHPWQAPPPEWAASGIVAVTLAERLGTSPLLAGHKHLNRLEQVLLRRALAAHAAAQEAVVCDIDGHVIEGVAANLFFVRAGVLHTPGLSRAGVAGVMRAEVLAAAARAGIATCEGEYLPADLAAADEVFFCNSVQGIWPVRELDGRACSVGLITRQLQRHWQDLLEAA
ncbi:MAG: aminodeoxychorismate lyase [Moraxellaceae bacterium]